MRQSTSLQISTGKVNVLVAAKTLVSSMTDDSYLLVLHAQKA
ncbi:MAG TPA: hypothetical protein VER35_01100 [Candidatus Limnocylindrales bacterium]|nr:hypothetical protein [Candidatus Limnocylindrales bacterium]